VTDTAGYDWADEAFPWLLSAARSPYSSAVRTALEKAGFEDVPKRGMSILGGIARNGPATVGDFADAMGVSKQAVSQLIDTLFLRGYIHRTEDGEDRRRTVVELTARGAAAAKVSIRAVDRIDRRIERQVGKDAVATTRRVLGALTQLAG
jgi:DNA-binding MarR family transcriptional regulator